ncbi:recombinase family protein [Nesterenkonia flava]
MGSQHNERHPPTGEAVDKSAEENLKTLDSSGQVSVNGSMSNLHTQPQAPVDPFAALAQGLTPKRAVSYLRVSTREQAQRGGREEGFSIPAQRDANKKKARSLGAEVVKEFVERGVSGTSTKRPALQEMLKYLEEEAQQIDYVIVHKVDRLARSRRDDAILNARFEELGVRLISTSENIDQTPGGMLLHGIMSSIAEFYSRNLANEVIKGMKQKVEQGGTPTIAPIGYLNQRIIRGGYEEATVIVDPDRAHYVTASFKEFATGRWTTTALLKEMTDRGFTTRPTKQRPSQALGLTTFQSMLKNPYYTGRVNYNGITYPGNHEPLIDDETFEEVQRILETRDRVGQRDRVHDHHLKSVVFCQCGERLILQKVKNGRGVPYDYFACAGRHGKRNDCKMRFVPVDWLEDEITRLHERIRFSHEYRQSMETVLQDGLREIQKDTHEEREQLARKISDIERKQRKLLEMHYDDESPVDILREEQKRLQREHTSTKQRLEAISADFEQGEELIRLAMDLAENAGQAYRYAPDKLKRELNMLFFSRIIVHEDEIGNHSIEYQLEPPMDIIFSDEARDIVSETTTTQVTEGTAEEPQGTSDLTASGPRIEKPAGSIGSGGFRVSKHSAVTPVTRDRSVSCLSNRVVVGLAGFEPTTSRPPDERATKLRYSPLSCCRTGTPAEAPEKST